MKKKIAVLLAFMMILSTMCSLNLVSAEPSADAPIYHFVAGKGNIGGSAGNRANGEKLFESWEEFESGLFPLAVVADNAQGALGGTFVITYDPAKVTLMSYDDLNYEWLEATAGSKIWFSSAHSAQTGASAVASGFGEENGRGYLYTSWIALGGEFDTDELIARNVTPELGCYVFKTNDGVTINDFDENTFKFYEGNTTSAEITAGLASGGSPLSFNTKVNGVEVKFGITDSLQERKPMTVDFIYPNSTPAPVETFTVTFVADGVTVKEITKNAGETVTTAEFPAVPEKDGFIGVWDVTTDITTTTTVTARYTPVAAGEVTLSAIFTDGFVKDYTFDPDTKTYSLEAIPGNADYVIAGYTDDENVASITYSIDDGAYEPANTENAYYFKLTRGQKSSVKIKLTDKAGGEVIYTFEVLIPGAANEVPLFETSGFELDNFDPAVREYTVTADPDETYVRLWGKAAAVVDGDDQRTIEYAVGDATDDPADMTYEALAVNCDQREDTYFAGTPNFDVNWSEKGFVTLWTEDGLSGKAMFVKVTGEGNPEPGYYKIIFE